MLNVHAIERHVRVYFGFSRMSHSVLDVGHPAVGALLAMGAFPSITAILLGLATAFAGFTAVFALNDLMDHKVDTTRMEDYRRNFSQFDLDVLGVRHPLAQRMLTFAQGLTWVVIWGIAALVGAYALSPLCSIILMIAVILEIVYCALLRVTHWKGPLSGAMVGTGALAGAFAVMKEPSWTIVVLLFLWAFAWEFGARNIPNDWTDLEEDLHLGARTFPVRYGRVLSSKISFFIICATVAFSLLMPVSLTTSKTLLYEFGALAMGLFFLIIPAWAWVKDQTPESAMSLFNRACLYPGSMLLVTAACLLV